MKIQLKLDELVLHEINAREITQDKDICIGRSASTDWPVPKDQNKASSRHATLGREGNLIILRDLESTNGTFLNGERITTRILKVGDQVRIGKMWVVVSDEGSSPIGDGLCLILRTGPNAGSAYPVREGLNVIGSSPDCSIQLNDPIVSQIHAELRVTADGYTIKDLGSTNGTVLGKERLPAKVEVPIKLKDNLFIAHYGLVFSRGRSARSKAWIPLVLGGLLAAALVAGIIVMIASGGSSANDVDLSSLASARADIPTLITQAGPGELADELTAYADLAESFDRAEKAILNLDEDAALPKPAPEFSQPEIQQAYQTHLAPRVKELTRLSRLAEDLAGLPDDFQQVIADWLPGGAIDKALAFDCLSLPMPVSERTEPQSEYDRLLGVESFYTFLFDQADAFGSAPIDKTPFVPQIATLKPLIPLAASAASIQKQVPEDSPLGKKLAPLNELLDGLQAIVPTPPLEDRSTFLRGGIALYLGLEGIKASHLEDGYIQVDSAIESADEADYFRYCLPGDKRLKDLWRKGPSP